MTDRDIALQNYLNNPCPATRNDLIAHHHGLIRFVMHRYLRIPRPLHEDAFQEGVLGLCAGIAKFNPTAGKFQSYAIAWVRASIQRWMERNIKETRCAPMNKYFRYKDLRTHVISGVDSPRMEYNGSFMGTIPDPSPGPQEYVMKLAIRKRVHEVIARVQLDSREEAIIKENICEDVPLNILAERFGVTKQRMCQIKKSLMSRMENSLEPEEGRGQHH